MTWREVWKRFQKELPRDATPQQRAMATKRAAAYWRSIKSGGRRRNPPPRRSGTDVGKVILVGGALYLAYLLLQRLSNPPVFASGPCTVCQGVNGGAGAL